MTDSISNKTPIIVDDAIYDSKNKLLILFVRMKLTGEQKILVNPKSSYHWKDGQPGDFPDKEMYKTAQMYKGKSFLWQHIVNVDTQQINATTAEQLAKNVGQQMVEITDVLSEDDRIINRKKEELEMIEEVRKKIRKKINEN